jgi:hypothetical protein
MSLARMVEWRCVVGSRTPGPGAMVALPTTMSHSTMHHPIGVFSLVLSCALASCLQGPMSTQETTPGEAQCRNPEQTGAVPQEADWNGTEPIGEAPQEASRVTSQ